MFLLVVVGGAVVVAEKQANIKTESHTRIGTFNQIKRGMHRSSLL